MGHSNVSGEGAAEEVLERVDLRRLVEEEWEDVGAEEREERPAVRLDLRAGSLKDDAAWMWDGFGREEEAITGEGGLASSPAALRHSSGESIYFSMSCVDSRT
jgi:hypothetical protein